MDSHSGFPGPSISHANLILIGRESIRCQQITLRRICISETQHFICQIRTNRLSLLHYFGHVYSIRNELRLHMMCFYDSNYPFAVFFRH